MVTRPRTNHSQRLPLSSIILPSSSCPRSVGHGSARSWGQNDGDCVTVQLVTEWECRGHKVGTDYTTEAQGAGAEELFPPAAYPSPDFSALLPASAVQMLNGYETAPFPVASFCHLLSCPAFGAARMGNPPTHGFPSHFPLQERRSGPCFLSSSACPPQEGCGCAAVGLRGSSAFSRIMG